MGNLFSWFEKQSAIITDQAQIKYHIMPIALNNEKIIMATCAISSCCALNEKGEIYFWNGLLLFIDFICERLIFKFPFKIGKYS